MMRGKYLDCAKTRFYFHIMMYIYGANTIEKLECFSLVDEGTIAAFLQLCDS